MITNKFYYDTKQRYNLWSNRGFKNIDWMAITSRCDSRAFCVVHSNDVRANTQNLPKYAGDLVEKTKYRWKTFKQFLKTLKTIGQPCAIVFVSGGGAANGPLNADVDEYKKCEPYIHFYQESVEQTGKDETSIEFADALNLVVQAWDAGALPDWNLLYTRWDLDLLNYFATAARRANNAKDLKCFLNKTWDESPLSDETFKTGKSKFLGNELAVLIKAQKVLSTFKAGNNIRNNQLKDSLMAAINILGAKH